eukprot:SAG31_NODE_276_length_18650_cov_5.821842_13_plen_52_part_00
MEQLRQEAFANNAGKDVGEKWEQVIDMLTDADDSFDDIMQLYKLEGDEDDQ